MPATGNKNRIGFWRRFAALWIDVFVIYSITKFLIVLISLTGFRISFEALFIFTGALYSMVMLAWQSQTTGKMIMQIIVSSGTDAHVISRALLLREVLCKWGITVMLPMILGRFLFGNTWLPTVFDILVMILVSVLVVLYFLVAKRVWYEQLAGLTVVRNRSVKKAKTGLYVLILAAVLGIGTTLAEYRINGRISCRMAAFHNMDPVKPYVKFLREQKTGPVDYVIGLFDKYDIVVLCERAHPEMTQWDFIYDILRDPRFISKSGHLFTEYSHVGMQDYMNDFMMTDSLSESEVHQHVIHIMRNMPVWPAWTNYNLYQYLKRLYRLNQTLPPENRIQNHFTDASPDWSSIKTQSDYREYDKRCLRNRDEIMAKTVIDEMRILEQSSGKPPKCLVIMNYRHAMDLTDRLPEIKRVNTYEFLKDSFGDRAANVLINTRLMVSVPLAGGVWDAAFEKTGNKPLGFDFQGSPFGTCYFDLFPFDVLFQFIRKKDCPSSNGSLRYRDVFTGFVFTHPLKDQYFQSDPPGFFDGFEEEYIRRSACLGDKYKKRALQYMKSTTAENPDPIKMHTEFVLESLTELIFYGLSGIGLIIGLLAYFFMNRKAITGLCVVLLLLSSCKQDNDTDHAGPDNSFYDIILVIGQSNTHQGIGLDRILDAPSGEIRQFGRFDPDNYKIIPAEEPLDHFSKLPDCIGFALTFAKEYSKEYLKAGSKILIIPGGMGGTGFLSNHWNPGDPLYNDAVERTNFVLEHFKSKLAVILWHQGESDIGNASYQENLDSMIVQIRKDVTGDNDTVPFILGGLVPFWTDSDSDRIMLDQIIANTLTRIKNTGFANPRIPFMIEKPDNAYIPEHFNATGQREMGFRYFSEYKILVP